MIKYLIGTCLVLLSLFSPVQPGFAATGTTPLPTPIGRVVWIKGTLTAVSPNNETRNLQKKSIIYLHDTLKTDNKSQAEMVFTDNTLITFKEDTTYTIDKYNDKNHGTNGSFVSNLTTGGFRTITGLIAKNSPDSYQVNMPVATIGVRGTDYQAVMHAGKFYMGLYKGKPCVTNKPKDPAKKGSEECLTKDHPFAEVVDPNMPPKLLVSAPPELGSQLMTSNATMLPFEAFTSPSGGPITNFCITQ